MTSFLLSALAAATLAAGALSGGQAPSAPAPAAATISSNLQRIVIVRLKNGTDMLAGLKQAVARESIRNAVILSGFGSVTSYQVHVVGNTTLPPKDVFTKESGPFDLTGVGGLVIGGRVHAHITLASTRKVIAGHLEPGTYVFTFAAISLAVLSDSADLSRVDQWQWH